MRIPIGRVILLCTSILLACATLLTPPSDPFFIPRQQFFDSVKTIVVTNVSVVDDTNVPDSILTEIETLIGATLQDADLTVVSATEYAEIWHRIADAAGGFFDPYTGERDEAAFQAAAERLRNELIERFDPDALLYPEIWEVDAPFSVGEATWGGVRQRIVGGFGYSGDIVAATLLVTIQNLSGDELYSEEAGLQALEYMQDGEFLRLNEEQLFSDSTLIPTAVSRTLNPLVHGRPAIHPEF